MKITEFISSQYPIADIVKARMFDPVKAVEEADNLPYDAVGIDDSGRLVKQVEIEDGQYIPVVELISYTEEDIVKAHNDNLKQTWNAYMSMIDLQDIDIADIMTAARKSREIRDKRDSLLSKCTT